MFWMENHQITCPGWKVKTMDDVHFMKVSHSYNFLLKHVSPQFLINQGGGKKKKKKTLPVAFVALPYIKHLKCFKTRQQSNTDYYSFGFMLVCL